MMITTTIDDLERRLADLHEQHTATVTALEEAGAVIAPLDAARDVAQAVYDEAGRGVAQALQGGPTSDPYGTWTPKSAAEEERHREAQRLAEAAFQQADAELRLALVAQTEGHKRRGDLLMHSYRIEAAITETVAQLERAQQAAEPQRDLLARIRARVLGQPQPAA